MVNENIVTCPFCGYLQGRGPEEDYFLPPETILIGRYIVGKTLGNGGFGITYLGYDGMLNRAVAIKEYFPSGLVSRKEGTKNVTTYSGSLGGQYHTEKLCMNCMQEKPSKGGVCPHCHYDSGGYEVKPHHLAPLDTILNGRYLLGRVLGEGGFGITYVALDLQTGQRIAIKELFIAGLLKRENTRTVLVENDMNSMAFYRECKDKFIQEANLMRRLKDKKGVVDIYSFFEENATAYIVMEYLDGDDLLVYLNHRGGRIPFGEAFLLLRPIMKSLIEMHKAGVFHRDIAPDNIRYLSDGSMKIMDLGGAKYNYNPNWKNSTIVMVKHGYAPPEQYTSGYKIGPWMDVYAMSATFYRCVTGKVLKQSTSRKGDEDIEKPTDLVPDFPAEAERVLLKGLALNTEDRYVDMSGLYRDLRKVAVDLGVISSPTIPHIGQQPEDERWDEGYQNLIDRLNHTSDRKDLLTGIAAGILAVIFAVAVLSSVRVL
ncbi:MAG: protein kinase [Lachnospiraceae bacterium]|nr:protein kinase [Lachnospiraceae bacterium]